MFVTKRIEHESMVAQLTFLKTIQARHTIWAQHADDREVANAHLEIAACVEQAIDQYGILFDRYFTDEE